MKRRHTCVVIFDVKRDIVVVLLVIFAIVTIDVHFVVSCFICINYIGMELDEWNRTEYLIATNGIHSNLSDNELIIFEVIIHNIVNIVYIAYLLCLSILFSISFLFPQEERDFPTRISSRINRSQQSSTSDLNLQKLRWLATVLRAK